MRCLALVAAVLALLPAAAGAQQTAAASPERWFAIAWQDGSRRHLGPFSSLASCEDGRLARVRDADRRVEEISRELGLPDIRDPRFDEMRAKVKPQLDARTSTIPWAEARFWQEKAICERL